MKYRNPVLPGYYPDPSICTDGDKFYLVNSSFQHFPGVPLFESQDLINWKQIGHVLSRESQLPLEHAIHSAGIFAPVIRYNPKTGRFYMITTNVSDGGNFIVHTDDIHGEWSEPVWITNGGIDPSLLFDGDKTYFTGNGQDAEGKNCIFVCEIDPDTGENLTQPVPVWHGTGGRYLEGPHLYHIGEYYYIFAAEGGTEYGHMIVYGKGKSPYGPFESYPKNPVLTNRNLGGYAIQGVGHGDLIPDKNGNYWMVHLAYRTIGQYENYHVTGRETYLVPVTFDQEGWFTAGEDGVTRGVIETDRLPESLIQELKGQQKRTFFNTSPEKEWIYQRHPKRENYAFSSNCFHLIGAKDSLNDRLGQSTWIGIRQEEMEGNVSVNLELTGGRAGLSVYMDEENHYDLELIPGEASCAAVNVRLGEIDACHRMMDEVPATWEEKAQATLKLRMTREFYCFSVEIGGRTYDLGKLNTRLVSTEVTSGFTGVILALYAEEGADACFRNFELNYCEE